MKKILYLLFVLCFFGLESNAQIESLAGPRIGVVYITASPGSMWLNGDIDLDEIGDLPPNYDEIVKGAFTTLYGWQWESRFAEGGDVTGIVEWVALAGGMERGKFLPSVSSLVGARTNSGFEFAIGPNLSLSGVGMVFGLGYNFKSGNLNMPVNIAFLPGRKSSSTVETYIENDQGPDGLWGTSDDINGGPGPSYDVDYNTGSRISITVGFNMNR